MGQCQSSKNRRSKTQETSSTVNSSLSKQDSESYILTYLTHDNEEIFMKKFPSQTKITEIFQLYRKEYINDEKKNNIFQNKI